MSLEGKISARNNLEGGSIYARGPKGNTPIKGVDYFTEQDILEMETTVQDNIVNDTTNKFSRYVATKIEEFDTNATNNTTTFNNNVETQTIEFNTNAINKVNEYNQNASDLFNKTDILQDEIDDVDRTISKTSVAGTNSLSYEDAQEYRVSDIIKGNTLQDAEPTPTSPQEIKTLSGIIEIKRTGKNIWGGYTFTKTNGGVTYTHNFDGSLTLNGTRTSTSLSISMSEAAQFAKKLSSGTYTLSGGESNIFVQIYDIDTVTQITNTNGQYSTTFTLNEPKK